MRNQPDSEILSRLPSLHAEHHSQLLRYLVRLTQRADVAEDLAQETWVRAITRGNQYRGEVPFKFWLFSIARNLHVDWRRRVASSRTQAVDQEEEVDFFSSVPDPLPSPLSVLLTAELAAHLVQALEQLGPATHSMIVQMYQYDTPLRKVAAEHEINLSTAKSQIYRGIKRLKPPLLALMKPSKNFQVSRCSRPGNKRNRILPGASTICGFEMPEHHKRVPPAVKTVDP